jgi:integrase
VIPTIGTQQVRAIHEREILTIVRAIAARGAPNMAIKVLNSLKQMFGWGEDRMPWRRLIEVNPAGSIGLDTIVGRDYEEGADTRPLAEREIPELRDRIKALRDQYDNAPDKRVAPQPLEKRTELAIWIMLGTCCRVGEIGRARRADIDLDTRVWTIPKEHSKNQDAHVVFLSDFAARQFKALLDLPSDSAWLFPSAKERKLHADVKNITKQIGDRQLSKSNRDPGKKRVNAAGADALLLSGGGWTPHDLRRTGSTMMEALGVMPAVIDKCLNHREPNKLRRTYLRYDYAKEKREAWRLLGERLDLLTRTDAQNVIALKIPSR